MNDLLHNTALLLLGLSALAALWSCGESAPSTEMTCPPTEEVETIELPVIYGDLSLVSAETAMELLSAPQRRAVEAEVALFRRHNLSGEARDPLSETSLLCHDEPLAQEVALSFCSGILVSPDLAVTAKHCLDVLPCNQIAVTTKFDHPIWPGEPFEFHGRRCRRVLAEDPFLDAAVIELERDQQFAAPFAPLRLEEVSEATPVIFISHPLGVSTKIDLDARARPSARGPEMMWLKADSFQGSSGGGVIDDAGRLVGIVTAGLGDFNYDHAKSCMRLAGSESEGFERLVSVVSVLKEACETAPENTTCRELTALDRDPTLTPQEEGNCP